MLQQINHFENIQRKKQKVSLFPCRPSNIYNNRIIQSINKYAIAYHCQEWIKFEDSIQLNERQQYLKRFYKEEEYIHKIQLLGQYYKYHVEAPKSFIQGIGRIIQTNTQQKRMLQYNQVTKYNKFSQRTSITKKKQPQIKLLKDIQLSYDNFQNKEVKKTKKDKITNQNKIMKRVISVQGEKGLLGNLKNGHYVKQINPKQFKYKKPNKNQKKSLSKKVQQKKIKGSQFHKPSANNSLASQKNLSRSKSKTNLHILQSKKNLLQNKALDRIKKPKINSAHTSNQNSFAKITDRQQNAKNKIVLIRSNSKNNFKQAERNNLKSKNIKLKQQKSQKVEKIQKKCKILKSSSGILHPIKTVKLLGKQEKVQTKGMFRKAIQIRKRCS